MERRKIMGKMLVELRLARGYTQTELSELIGMPQRTYASYETGKHEPNITNLIKLAEIYGVSLDYITGRYQRMPLEEMPDRFIDEIEYMSSPDRQDDEVDAVSDLIEQRASRESQISLIESKPKRGKYNRVKKNKPPV